MATTSTTPTPEPTAAQHAAALVAAYTLAEARLLAGFTGILRGTQIAENAALTALGQMRRLVRRILEGLAAGDHVAQAMVSAAAVEGERLARRQTRTLRAVIRAAGVDSRSGSRGPGDGRPPGRALSLPEDEGPFDLSLHHPERSAQAIRDDIVSELEDVRRRITRLPDDVYKMIARTVRSIRSSTTR